MKVIIKDGREKEFYTRCPECATEFVYALSDVYKNPKKEEIKQGGYIFRYADAMEYPYVYCPVCNQRVMADKLTREEFEKLYLMPRFWPV